MQTSVFWVRSERRGACAYLHLNGELDIASVPTLDRWLEEVGGNGNLEIVVDLQNLMFMDASGVHSLLRASVRADQSGRRFGVINPPPIARRIFEITKTAFLINHPDAQQASRTQELSDQSSQGA